ncbi:NUDIX domain-containing protein [Gynuella sp.]|uniref:NUDIX domain-containing protein n=1 Tax=Gynuella sp. TaxID=2969146 RepID=UPI003D0B07FC
MEFKIINRERVFDGFYKLDRFRVQHELFNGGMGAEIVREVMVRPDAVCVLLFDPTLDQLVFVEQFRVAASFHGNPWLLELVAGLIDKDETPEQVGRREAMEEAGLSLGRMEKICDYLPSPGGSNEKVFLYAAEVDSANAGGIYGLEEEGEDIKVHVLTTAEAFSALENGKINNAAGIMALQWLQLHKTRLQSLWSH